VAKKNLLLGMALPREARERLRKSGIFVQTAVTLEHQNLGQRYVVRGVESGGGVLDFGHYVTFAAEDGSPLPHLCPVQSLAVNGPHAVVIAPVLLRGEMLRAGNAYELLVTCHSPNTTDNGKRPRLASRLVFRGQHGFLARSGAVNGAGRNGSELPQFWTRAGEPQEVPEKLRPLIEALKAGVCCTGCSHSHYVQPPGSDHRLPGAIRQDGNDSSGQSAAYHAGPTP